MSARSKKKEPSLVSTNGTETATPASTLTTPYISPNTSRLAALPSSTRVRRGVARYVAASVWCRYSLPIVAMPSTSASTRATGLPPL